MILHFLNLFFLFCCCHSFDLFFICPVMAALQILYWHTGIVMCTQCFFSVYQQKKCKKQENWRKKKQQGHIYVHVGGSCGQTEHWEVLVGQ